METQKQDKLVSQGQGVWVTPRLMRLNQAEGTDKHLDITESVAGTGLVYPTCAVVSGGSGGGGVCGPS